MGRFRFNLENVIKVRQVAENLAQRDFQLAQAELHQQQQNLQKMFDEKAQAFQQRHIFEDEGGSKAPHLGQVQDFLQGQEIRIQRQQAKIQDIETQVERLREILRERSIELKIIEKLKEKRRVEFVSEENRREVKEADDQSMMRFKSGRRGNEDGI